MNGGEYIAYTEEVYLKGHMDFVKVNNLYYGGHQIWLYSEKLRSKFWSNRACGVIAAGNSLIHMSMYRKGLERIYKYPSITRKEFAIFANEIYDYLKPTMFGIYDLKKMDRGLRRFVKSKGIILESKILSNPKSIDRTIEFIKGGIMSNSPVLMLTWNTKIKVLRYHWVTITGYIKKGNNNYIIISNWGEIEEVSLDSWVQNKSLNKGLIYFNISPLHLSGFIDNI